MQNVQFDYDQYKKRLNKKNSSFLPLIIVLIIGLLGFAFYLTNSNNEQEFYFVQINEFASYKDANNLANEIQSKKAGGYIYYDGQYHVLANFYIKKEDAETVANNLKAEYPYVSVFSISASKKIKTNQTSTQQTAYINDFNLNVLNNIQELTNLSLSHDKNEISFSQCKVKIQDLYSKTKASFDNLFSIIDKTKHISTFKASYEITLSLDNLIHIEEAEFSTYIKYELIKIVVNYSLFLSSF